MEGVSFGLRGHYVGFCGRGGVSLGMRGHYAGWSLFIASVLIIKPLIGVKLLALVGVEGFLGFDRTLRWLNGGANLGFRAFNSSFWLEIAFGVWKIHNYKFRLVVMEKNTDLL